MKKISLVIFLISFISIQNAKTQTLNNDRIDFINPSFINPSFIMAENTLQVNLIGSYRERDLSTTEKDYSVGSILNLEKINSSFLLSYGHESDWKEVKDSFYFGYSYATRVSDNLRFFSGVSYHDIKIINHYFTIGDFTNESDTEVNGSNLKLGLRLAYKQLNVGFGYRQNLSNNQLDKHEYKQLQKLRVTANEAYLIYNRNFAQEYSVILYREFNISRLFTLIPQTLIIWRNGSRLFNLGLKADYKNLFGIGFVNDVRGDLILLGNVKIMKGIWLYSILLRGKSFPYDKKQGWDLNGQIRIDI